ncbi:MAG: hypothetical protein HY508_12470 [Acidobacteria bacterium]|nr:hypothetical protein [Acidobacteriota bacterium]
MTPSGTTLLESTSKVNGFDVDLIAAPALQEPPADDNLPLGEWHNHQGIWRLPYDAGIPGEAWLTYLPDFGFKGYLVPSVRGLEPGLRYDAYYWEPSLGIKLDLGTVDHAWSGIQWRVEDARFARKLRNANGKYRSELSGPGWDDYGRHPQVEGDTYKLERPPTMGDWVLVLEAQK